MLAGWQYMSETKLLCRKSVLQYYSCRISQRQLPSTKIQITNFQHYPMVKFMNSIMQLQREMVILLEFEWTSMITSHKEK